MSDPDGRARTVLMVLYFFPPIGGVSMSRGVRNVAYLPRFGWRPVVLTPKAGAFELQDPGALRLVPNDVPVLRTPSVEAGHLRPAAVRMRDRLPRRRSLRHEAAANATGRSAPDGLRLSTLTRLRRLAFFPDDQVGWLPFALRAAVRARRSTTFDAVFSSSSPVTSHLIAGLFARLTGTPWVAEFRDPWLGNVLAPPLPWLHRRLQAKIERWIVRSADCIVCVTPSLTRLYQRRYPGARRIVTITNGYDRSERADVTTTPPGTRSGSFRIVYTGTLYRDSELRIFLEGVERLIRRRPELVGVLDIVFYGEVTEPCRVVADRFIELGHLAGVIRFSGFVPRQEAIEAVARANAALVLLGAGPGMGLFVGGKLYDYIGQDQQILAMVPPGDARDVLEELDWGVISDPDPAAVEMAVERLLDLPAPGRPADLGGRYDRVGLAGRLAAVLTEVSAGDPRRRERA